jgi:pyruvate/2-oxoglutarate dehydrogenase complex dihydrolipoamide dehydrogenase (E3) component
MRKGKGEAPTYDVVVIGGGSAGISAAEGAVDAGASSVCIVEEELLGGECPYEACVPTKTLLASSKLYYKTAHEAGHFGVDVKGVSFDWSRIMKRKNAVVNIITGNDRLLKYLQGRGISVIKGRARFEDDHTVRAGAHLLKSKAFVIATGSKSIIPPIHGIEDTPYLTYEGVSTLKKLPRSIAIIGAGPVGAEFATFFGELGIKTALIDRSEHILPREEAELSALGEERLSRIGVHILTKSIVLGVKKERSGVMVTYQTGKAPRKSMLVEMILIASGKRADVKELNLEAAGVKEENGRINLDQFLRTNVKHVFVAGDASSHQAFTHTAHHEGVTAGWNAAHAGKTKGMQKVDLEVVPRVTFLNPEIASVGLTASEAVKAGHTIKIYKAALSVLARSAIDGRREGMIKIITDKKTDKVLGAHMLGERSGEVIHELALLMKSGLPLHASRSMLHAYPTYSEIISAAQML